MFGIGPYEMLVVGFVALLIFGHKLPDVMRNLGRGVSEFKKGIANVEDEIRRIEDAGPASTT
jgi:sec-independent protein translocase protein TatA